MKKFVVAGGHNDGKHMVELEKEAEFDTFEQARDYIGKFENGEPSEFNHFEILEYFENGEIKKWSDLPSVFALIL